MLCDASGRSAFFACYTRADDHPEATIYESMDEAAIAAGTLARLETNRDNIEYGYGIYLHSNGGYSIGKSVKGEHDSVNPSIIIEESKSKWYCSLVAIVHSHPYCTGHIGEEFSGENGDIGVVAYYKLPLYLATPGGLLKKAFIKRDFYLESQGQVRIEIAIICDTLPKSDPQSIINCQ